MLDVLQSTDGGILLALQAVRSDFLDPLVEAYTSTGNAGMIWIVLSLAMLCFKPTRKAGVLALCAMACIREVFGAGTFCGLPVPWFHDNPISILTMAPGGFVTFGVMIALVNKISKGKAIKKKEFGCAGCPGCGKASCSGKEAAAK